MGVPAERVQVTDTMKWDTAQIADPSQVMGADALAAAMGIDRSKPIIVAGSTGPGEEEMLARACPPDVQLVIAPRKPERFEEVAGMLELMADVQPRPAGPGPAPPPTTPADPPPEPDDSALNTPWEKPSPCGAGLDWARPALPRRSLLPDGSARPCDGTRVFLLDTLGELRKAYAIADVVIVGRSFINLYGSDPIEPIALGKPTIIGPRFKDFADIVEAFLAAGGIVVSNQPMADAARLLADRAAAAQLAERGRGVILSRQGATQRHVAMIATLCSHPSPSGDVPRAAAGVTTSNHSRATSSLGE
jgi:3-deoxy-D-manno-octulosonic-acid transferase